MNKTRPPIEVLQADDGTWFVLCWVCEYDSPYVDSKVEAKRQAWKHMEEHIRKALGDE